MEEEDFESRTVRVGTTVAAGVVAALVGALPAVFRASASRASLFVALTALGLPFAILLAGILRRARVGLRALLGERIRWRLAAILWWVVLETGALTVLGAMLRATTHHRGLGGVTFAFLALVAGIVIAIVAARGARLLASLGPTAARPALAISGLFVFAAFALAYLRGEPALRAGLVDGLVLLAAALVSSAPPFARHRGLAVAGILVACPLVLVGLDLVRESPTLASAVSEDAPLHAVMLGTIAPAPER